MRSWLLLFPASAVLAAAPVSAGNIWVSLHDGKRDLVTELGPQGPRTALAQPTVLAFGESPTRIAVVAYDVAAARNQLHLLDKQTRALVATWALPTTPVSLLSGAAPDIVLLDECAYVLLHATILSTASSPVRNQLGGMFNVIKVALRTGEISVLPLSNDFFNPRLRNYEGVPVVTDWAGYAVWRLAADGAKMVRVIGKEQLSDILPAERTDPASRALPYNARPDYVAVPGAGVFRVSRFGLLHRITGPDLAPLPAPHVAMAIGPAQHVEALLAASTQTGPAIAVVRRVQDRRMLTFIDATSLAIAWERELPTGTSPWSMVEAGEDAVMYIDTDRGALMQSSRDGTVVLRKLPASQHYSSAHILSAGGT
jgi:hypothetical protein